MKNQENQEEGKVQEEKKGPQLYSNLNIFSEVGSMKKGDYMIHVYLQQGKQFKTKADSVKPIIEFACCDMKKYSSSKSDVGPNSVVFWGEHIFFEPTNQTKNQIEQAQIQIRVLNKGIFKDDLLGAFDIDLTMVYFQDKHAIFHQWIALSNPESDDFNEITCYLRLSISVAGPGDEQIPLNDDSVVDKSEDAQVLMPASIRKEFKQVKFRFLKGEKFPKMDQFGTIDAYFQTTYLRKKLKTKAVTQTKQTQETVIDQEFWLPIQWPVASDRIVLKLYDEDKINDEIVGSMYFSLKEIVKGYGENGILKWFNLYGAPLGCSGNNTTLMNDNPEFASTWKGRTLMHISAYDVKNPEMKVSPLDSEFKEFAIISGAYGLEEYELIAEFGSGISLASKNQYQIRICINDFTIESSKPKEAKEGYCRWSERLEPVSFQGPYKSIEELGRIYIYLVQGGENVCYWNGECKDFLDPNPQYRWIQMKCDLAKGKITKSEQAGLVSLKLSINHKSKNGKVDFKQQVAWKKPPPKRLRAWKIRCYIFQCKDIPSADSDGSSDPYISIWNQDAKKIQTIVVEDNTNPIFFETLEVYYDYDTLNDAPPIVLNIWDKDEAILDADDFLGRSVIYLKDAALSQDDTIPEPKWHDIKMTNDENEPAAGQILCSFAVVEDDYTFKIPLTYMKLTEQIEYKEFKVDINILGLRQLQSFGLMPVKKPFIKFNLRSLLPPEKAQAITNIKTQPSAPGPDANINTLINFVIDLPVNPLFCPKLQCDVYDYVFKGLVQPLLGTFSLAIGQIMHEQKTERQQLIQQSDLIITYLRNELSHSQQVHEDDIEVHLRGPGDILEEGKQEFEKRVQGFNNLAEGITEVELDTSQMKQKLIISEEDKQGQASIQASLGLLKTAGRKKSTKDYLSINQEEGEGDEETGRKSGNQSMFGSGGKVQKKKTQTVKYKTGNKLLEDLEAGMNFKMVLEKNIQKEQEKQNLELQRILDQEKLKEDGIKSHKNVLYPNYEFDDRLNIWREVNKPPSTIYMEIGHNQIMPDKPKEGNKHYRRFYADELENSKEIFKKPPFLNSDIIRGQSRGLSKGFFSFLSAAKTDESGCVTNEKKVGFFKGRITVENEEEALMYAVTRAQRKKMIMGLVEQIYHNRKGQKVEIDMTLLDSFEKSLKLKTMLDDVKLNSNLVIDFLKEESYNEVISKQLMTKQKAIVRLYILEGFDFAQRDIGSFSDPYLMIKCGKNEFNERNNYQLDEPNPKFFKMYEFDAEFPGACPLVISAYDYDDLFGDDLIGKTMIDLDDRFFSPDWQQIEQMPVEYRQIYHESSQCSQGVIKMWMEIHLPSSSTKMTEKVWDTTPTPINDYQLRLVVYDTKDVIMADVEGTTDAFIKAWIDDKDKKETDTHYRCQNGKASFNYRLLFDLKAPRQNHLLTLQIWDRDLFKKNDFLGEIQLDIKDLFEDVIATQKQMNFSKKYYQSYLKKKWGDEVQTLNFYDEDSFYVNCYDKDKKFIGKVRLGMSLIPCKLSTTNPVGGGRNEPNHSPYLPPPVGRISFTLNPFKMLNQLVGPELRRKIYCICCLVLCCALCAVMFPIIFSNLISTAIVQMFKS